MRRDSNVQRPNSPGFRMVSTVIILRVVEQSLASMSWCWKMMDLPTYTVLFLYQDSDSITQSELNENDE